MGQRQALADYLAQLVYLKVTGRRDLPFVVVILRLVPVCSMVASRGVPSPAIPADRTIPTHPPPSTAVKVAEPLHVPPTCAVVAGVGPTVVVESSPQPSTSVQTTAAVSAFVRM